LAADRKNASDKKRYEADEDYAEHRRAVVRKSIGRVESKDMLRAKQRTPEIKKKKAAMKKVEVALKNGTLIRPDECENCGKNPGYTSNGRTKIRAYHYLGHSMDHALDVKFWCATCVNRHVAVPRRRR
jgi:hypothetical protein